MENKTITTLNGTVLTKIDYPTLNINPNEIPPAQINTPITESVIPEPTDNPIYKELKQLNNKVSSQTGFEKQVYGEVKTEYQKQQKNVDKLSLKDWKLALIALGGALIALIIEHWNDILNFILSLIE